MSDTVAALLSQSLASSGRLGLVVELPLQVVHCNWVLFTVLVSTFVFTNFGLPVASWFRRDLMSIPRRPAWTSDMSAEDSSDHLVHALQ
eukprot:5918153-Amphidinium_carterae.1